MQALLLRLVLSLQVVILISCDASGQRANNSHTTEPADHGVPSEATNGPAEWKEPPLDIWDARTGQRVWDPNQPAPYPLAELERSREAVLRRLSPR